MSNGAVKSLDIAGTTTIESLHYDDVYWAIQNHRHSNDQYKLLHIDGKLVGLNSIKQELILHYAPQYLHQMSGHAELCLD